MIERKVAFITGAARGIGAGIAVDLARHGFDVVLTARSLDAATFENKPGTLRDVARRVAAVGSEALPLQLDLLDQTQIADAWAAALAHFGRIDLLVTSGNYMETGPGGTYSNAFVDVPWDAFERHARITGLSCLYLNQLAVRQMMKQRGGTIINITQNATWLHNPDAIDHLPLPGQGMPGMAIAVMRGITDRIPATIKREVAPYNIRVLTLDPGMTISVDRGLWDEVGTIGYRPEVAHSAAVPARAVSYIATRPDPAEFHGELVLANDLVRARGLLSEAEMYPDWREGPQDVETVRAMTPASAAAS